MKPTANKRHFVAGCIAFIILIALSTFSRHINILSALRSFGANSEPALRFDTSSHCSNIEDQPNQCAFVKSSCHGFNALYLELYYCSTTLWRPMAIAMLVTWLFVLFGAISVVASDFFCPNLQTISTKLQLSESMAGVTVLALGNGSPDLFSTFSAMDSGAGSMAIGELIGAAFFIVAIVSGCMGIIRPFQSQKITFTRDASFLTGAVAIMTWIVYHQQIHWYHSVILIGYYVSYVAAVVLGAYNSSSNGSTADPLQESKLLVHHPDESTHLLCHAKPSRLSIPDRGFSLSVQSNLSELNHLGHVIRPTSLNSSRRSLYQSGMIPRSASTHGSIMSTSTKTYRRPMTPRIGIRTSVFGAIEFQQQVNHMRRSSHSSQHIMSPVHQRRHRQQSMPPPLWQTLQLPAPHDPTSRRQRASTMTDQPFSTAAPSIHVVSPSTTRRQQEEEQDYFTFISAQHDHPLFHIQPSSPPPPHSPSAHLMLPEIRLDVPSSTALLTPDTTKSIHTPSITSDYDLFVSARQSFELSPCSAAPSFHKHLADHIMTSGMMAGHDALLLESPTLLQTLFPTLQDWHQKTFFSKWSALAALPLVLLFTLTLPVAEVSQIKVDDVQVLEQHGHHQDQRGDDEWEEEEEEEEESTVNYLSIPGVTKAAAAAAAATSDYDISAKITVDDIDTKQGWNKQLLMIQCVVSTAFILGVLVANKVIPLFAISAGLLLGSILALYIKKTTASHEPPSWFWILSFVGFFVALNWIFLLANQVVGLLQAIGQIFSISDAIMGLTVFALGNSIGDFVANTAIAKMGFPTMAISACYAGPLLNMVLGVGISSLYQFWKTGASCKLDIAPTIIISSAGLLTVLMSTLIAVSINGYRITKQLGWWMVAVYVVCLAVNLVLEFHVLF